MHPIQNSTLLTLIEDEPYLESYPEAIKATLAGIADKLLQAQEVMNLTAIKKPELIVKHHLADSAVLDHCCRERNWEAPSRAADIGTGGGFPLLPLGAIWPKSQWTGIESIAKKARYVEEAAKSLQLKNVRCLPLRAEDFGRMPDNNQHDLVTSRAVGPISSLLEVSLPLLKVGGIAALYKTEAAREEWKACQEFLKQLGGEGLPEFRYSLEGDLQGRTIFFARKVAETPYQYPRDNGLPFRKPIGAFEKAGR